MSDLPSEFNVEANNVDATTEDSKRRVEEYGFNNHGLVIHASTGDLLLKQADHSVDMDAVRQKLTARK